MSLTLDNIAAYCINLERRPDRKISAWSQFRRAGLKVDRIVAPDSALISQPRGWKNTGARACALAHRIAWRQASLSRARAVLIFEDDVILCDDFVEKLARLELPEDWKILYLGCTLRDVPLPISPGLVKIHGRTWETHAMIVNREIFRKLHRLVAPYSRCQGRTRHPIAEEIALDNLLVEIHSQEAVFAAYPALAWQTFGLSNIDNTRRGLWNSDGTQSTHPWVIERLTAMLPKR